MLLKPPQKVLREPTVDKINSFVDNIIRQQIDEKQFNDCNITLCEIEIVKKVLYQKIDNYYHLRVEYPEYDFINKIIALLFLRITFALPLSGEVPEW